MRWSSAFFLPQHTRNTPIAWDLARVPITLFDALELCLFSPLSATTTTLKQILTRLSLMIDLYPSDFDKQTRLPQPCRLKAQIGRMRFASLSFCSGRKYVFGFLTNCKDRGERCSCQKSFTPRRLCQRKFDQERSNACFVKETGRQMQTSSAFNRRTQRFVLVTVSRSVW